jgi:hypothetical protein
LDVNSDWKSPDTQSTDMSLIGVNPWRPAGGTDGVDFTLFTQHDPNGAVVFLPEGQYDKDEFRVHAPQRRLRAATKPILNISKRVSMPRSKPRKRARSTSFTSPFTLANFSATRKTPSA